MGMEALPRRAPPRLPLLVLLLAALAPVPARAQDDDSLAARRPTLTIGGELRVRWENWDNVFDFQDSLDDLSHQERVRTRIWTQLDVRERLQARLGICNEGRRVTTADDDGYRRDEWIFETLYLDYRFAPWLSARLGRQDLRYGEGFVVMDGTPGDDTRTSYVNALRLRWSGGPSTLDLLAISNPQREQYLPAVDDRRRLLVEWDEELLGLYYQYRRSGRIGRDLYYFYKRRTDGLDGVDGSAHTLGARAEGDLGRGWSGAVEAAGQYLTHERYLDVYGRGSGDNLAAGATLWAKRTFQAPLRPTLQAGLAALSGDDGYYGRWDPVLSRWPRWSELLVYTLAREHGQAYWTNLLLWQAQVQATPFRWMSLRATYYRLGAFDALRTNLIPGPGAPADPALFGSGRRRGDLWQLRADVSIRGWRGHVLGEYLAPGSFYAGRDDAWFFRIEVSRGGSTSARL